MEIKKMKKELEKIVEEKAKEQWFQGYEGHETTAFSHGAEFLHDELGYQFTKENMIDFGRMCRMEEKESPVTLFEMWLKEKGL